MRLTPKMVSVCFLLTRCDVHAYIPDKQDKSMICAPRMTYAFFSFDYFIKYGCTQCLSHTRFMFLNVIIEKYIIILQNLPIWSNLRLSSYKRI